jgi:ADP-ribosyl-[dinitrogen reductase] hydrolase
MKDPVLERAQGALVGALLGDAIGTQVEFLDPVELAGLPAAELLQFQEFGPWHTLPGQPNEDGELLMLQTRMLVYQQSYAEAPALQAYHYWLKTDPFTVDPAFQQALITGASDRDYGVQALARIAPIALMGVHYSLPQIAAWAMQDTALTHSSVICQQISGLYAMLLAEIVDKGLDAPSVLEHLAQWAAELDVDPLVQQAIDQALFLPSTTESRRQFAALAAFQNLVFQLHYAKSMGEALVDTMRLGGDTGTNCVVIGAVFGALAGYSHLPADWRETISNCRPQEGVTGVDQPRPEVFWPGNATTLVEELLALKVETAESQ